MFRVLLCKPRGTQGPLIHWGQSSWPHCLWGSCVSRVSAGLSGPPLLFVGVLLGMGLDRPSLLVLLSPTPHLGLGWGSLGQA